MVDDLYRQYIDIEVEAEVQRREYAGTQSWGTKTFRVVGVLVVDADDYIYIS
ncbi:transposase [Natronorubrum bangense JCM 10635]|uniref:Transposase n=1 Tax=Natronorubrum bangense JCM 10635 TaxID=1227500 RepID=L9W2V3_9EURY|nr:transposase [Natronorubrum bangense JCM 10635]